MYLLILTRVIIGCVSQCWALTSPAQPFHLFVTLLNQGFLHSMTHETSYPVYKYVSLGNWVQKQAANCVIFLNGHAYLKWIILSWLGYLFNAWVQISALLCAHSPRHVLLLTVYPSAEHRHLKLPCVLMHDPSHPPLLTEHSFTSTA